MFDETETIDGNPKSWAAWKREAERLQKIIDEMTTNNHPAHGPVSIDRLHQISEILSKAAAQSDGGNLGYAMADAVKVIDGAIASFGAEPVAWKAGNRAFITRIVAEMYASEVMAEIIPLYTAPQQAPVVQDIDRRAIADKVYGKCCRIPGATFYNAAEFAIDEVESLRAAMLQAGNHTEQHLDMVEHSGDANENVDCRLPFDQWLSQQNEPIDVDCGCVTTEAFYHWLRVAYEAGKSPVSPDGYVLVPKEMTPEMMRAVQIKSELGGYAASELSGAYDVFREFWDVAVSAAPQQE